jgi:D-ribulokinase
LDGHRATTEARRVNETRDKVLRYVGGSISPEMEIPKLLWLKRHLPSTYRSAGSFLRSCRLSLVSRHRIDGAVDMHGRLQMELSRPRSALEPQLFERVGLGDLVSDNYAKIGTEIVPSGTPLGAGLTNPRHTISASSKARRSPRR